MPSSAPVWVGFAMLVVGIAVGIGFSIYGTVVIINELQILSGVRVGSSGSVVVAEAGCRDVYLFAESGSLPSTDPKVTVSDPSGNSVDVSSSGCDRTSRDASSADFRVIGSFVAARPGAYTLKVGPVSGAGSARVVAGPPLGSLVGKVLVWFGLAFVVGGILFVVGLIVLIVGLVRRSRARKARYGPPPGPFAPGPPGVYPQLPGPAPPRAVDPWNRA